MSLEFIYSRYLLIPKFNIYISYKNSLIFLKGSSGFVVFRMPSFFFFKTDSLSLLFSNRFFFASFLKHFKSYYKNIFLFFFSKIKLRGLGFRVRRISKHLYRFFFNMTNYFYFFSPQNVLFKVRKKRILFLSILIVI